MARDAAPTEPGKPGSLHKPSFLLFILLAPAGFALIGAIILILQAKQFMAMVAPEPMEIPVPLQADRLRSESGLRLEEWLAGQGPDTVSLTEAEMQAWAAVIPSTDGKRYGLRLGDSTLDLLSTQPVSALKGRLDFLFQRLGKGGYLNAAIEGIPGTDGEKFGLVPLRATLDEVKVPLVALTKRGDLGVEDFWPASAPWKKEWKTHLDTAFISDGRLIGVRK